MSLYQSTALKEIERLERIDAGLAHEMKALDRYTRPELQLSIDEAKASLAKTRGWIGDAITCLRVDSGLSS